MSRLRSRRVRVAVGYVGLALLAWVPVFRSLPGKVAADTKQYLTLDPARLLGRAVTMWDPNIGMGTVTHQNIGYLFPLGPFYWLCERIGLPDWVAQRLWLGSLLFAAGAGVLYLLRTFGLRGPGVVVAAIAYMLTPYTLDYAARISVLLMPWAALPWMIGLMRKALRDGGWRYPAIFALVVQVVGGVNATALLFAGVGPALWILYSWIVAREVQWRRVSGVALRTGALTIAASLWWIVGLAMQGRYGLDILRYTETVEAVARTSTPNEIMRGLGYWFFYGQDRIGPWIEASSNYTQRPVVIIAGYTLAALALLSAGLVRWRHRVYFVGLFVVGVILAVGAHPYGSPTPLGALFKAFATGSTAGLAMRSTARAVPLVVLATAVLLGVGTNAVYAALIRKKQTVLAYGAVAIVLVLIAINFPALIDGTFYGENLQRPEEIPAYWKDVAAALDARDDGTRVLAIPGSDFASYRWGNTVDPVLPGLMDRPYVARELIPWGSPATADLLNAVDRRIQEGTLDPAGFAAIARRMSVGDVVLRNDLIFERYNLVPPREVNRAFASVPGLGAAVDFGTPQFFTPARASVDEIALAAPANEAPVAPVVVYPVSDALPIVHGASTQDALMIAGDGEGMVDAADVGLLDGAGIVQYSGSYESAERLRAAVGDDTTLVLTDTNRRRARRWSSVRDNLGVTEQPGEEPLRADLGDARLDVFPEAGDDAHSTIDQQGVARVTSTRYGNAITYTPEDAAARAFDGDVDTAWLAGALGAAVGERIRVDLDEPIATDHINVVQPLERARDRYITKVRMTFSGDGDGGGEDTIEASLDGSSRTAGGQTIEFDTRTFDRLEIEVVDTNYGNPRLHGIANAIGFAEVRLIDSASGAPVRVHEVVQMPTDLLDAIGEESTALPLVVLMTRDRIRPVPPRSDPERAIAREFTLPAAREFALTGTARVSSDADAPAIAAALGTPDVDAGAVRATAKEFMQGCVVCRPEAAIDGDLATAWKTPFVGVRDQWAEYELPAPITFDRMDLSVVADGRHSVPTRIRLEVGDDVRVLTLPPIGDAATENATATVPLTFPAVTGRTVRVTIEDVREVNTFSYFSNGLVLTAAGIAELGIPGLVAAAPATSLDSECRDDLLFVDGDPVPIRIIGTAADGLANAPLAVETCDPADPSRAPSLTLDAGPHEVQAALGVETALQLDRLVLASAAGGGPGTVEAGRVVREPTDSVTPTVEVSRDGRTRMRVRVDGATEPFWLVLGESENAGWRATTDGAALGPRRLVDGYANGWLVDPTTDESFDVVLEWAPQRSVWAGLGVSVAAVLGCLAIVAVTWWRRRAGALALVTAPAAADSQVSIEWPRSTSGQEDGVGLSPVLKVLVPVAVGVVGAVISAPWIGVVGAITVASAMRWRFARVVLAVLPALLVAGAGVYIAVSQRRFAVPPIFEWPTVFPRARSMAWLALVLLGGSAVLEIARRATRGGRASRR